MPTTININDDQIKAFDKIRIALTIDSNEYITRTQTINHIIDKYNMATLYDKLINNITNIKLSSGEQYDLLDENIINIILNNNIETLVINGRKFKAEEI